ncbi:MAG: helix-turn-helix domain-containing protein [Christensenellaceae bacterium]|nr:helix-turn-helix domain-containing protein [Christensenellaceae bacterium]
MKCTNYTHTTTEHATIIVRTALRTCAAKAGRSEKIDNMRAALAGRDAATMRTYGRAYDDMAAYDTGYVQPLTDAADLVQVAALAIIECAAPCIATAIAADKPYILPDTIRKAAYKAVHKAIYAAAVRPALRDIYIEDMAHTDDGMEISDPEYIKVTRYYDVHNWTDYAVTMDMLEQIKPLLKDKQKAVLHYRLQGMSVTAIAERLGVTQQAVSDTLKRIRIKAATLWPDETRAFKL